MPSGDDSRDESFESRVISFALTYKLHLAVLLLGLLMLSGGVFFVKSTNNRKEGVVVLNATTEGQMQISEVVVEISGGIKNPGVYKLPVGSRVEDAITSAGGFSDKVDDGLVSKSVNRAAKLVDGQKIYIPQIGTQGGVSAGNNISDQTISPSSNGQNSKIVNINTASRSQLEALWGIGPVTAQNIIDNRMYSSVEELLTKGIIKQNVYDRNKDLLTVY